MQKITSKQSHAKDVKSNRLTTNTSKNKKQLKQSSSKNIKTIKSINQKTQPSAEQSKFKQSLSPENTARTKQIQNDYGVNPYFAKYKVKTTRKKQSQRNTEPNQYGNLGYSKEGFTNQKNSKAASEESDYVQNAFQKLKLPNNRGVINTQGKFVPVKVQKKANSQSFHHKSMTKNSFSLNLTSREDSKRHKNKKSKSKQKRKIDNQRSMEYRVKHKSLDRIPTKQHTSYNQQGRYQKQPRKITKSKSKQIKQIVQMCKIDSIGSKMTSTEIQLETYSMLDIIRDSNFVEQVKESIAQQMQNSKKGSFMLKKNKQTEQMLKERAKCVQMLSRICGAMNMKRQSFSLAVFYFDRFILDFAYTSMKLVALSSLILALKMDDAEMTSKFCFHYLINPEKTVKRSGSNHLKSKFQPESGFQPKQEVRQIKSKLANILTCKISEQKKAVKEEFQLQQVLDFQSLIMFKFGFKLVTKTVTYWLDLLTTLWDSFISEFHPQLFNNLVFRNDKSPRNFSYLLQLLQLEDFTMDMYGQSKVAFILAAIYLLARMALQQKKEETPWQELCRYYKVKLSKTTNLIFCDRVGINSIFGDYLTLFQLSMSNIVNQIQTFSRFLQPSLLKVHEYKKIEALNREERLSIHIHPEQCFKHLGL